MANCHVCNKSLREIEAPTRLCSEHYFNGHMYGDIYVLDVQYSLGTAHSNNVVRAIIPAVWELDYVLENYGVMGHA